MRWELCSRLLRQPESVASRIASYLEHEFRVTDRVLAGPCFPIELETDPVIGGWKIWGDAPDLEDRPDLRVLWDCYEAVAQALLAMPPKSTVE